ncbi:2-oxoglutarate dehydrogenase, E2 component, dihydrolipoamide succinyltransferase [Corynebacterium ulceribovis]|uniref:2-oxoglutarate dehydrogenase, E2 component, dihydrolipoamide succinyltransferase n=1 Tax=Corynebacterium ulceribovis TaxID=487732 RepID=UPI00037F8830|nr:2-oxoglutarate dehydrogenase, E2 component, dihydrolipoamide succinyltransferase [Corynebacterium ulceribovis]
MAISVEMPELGESVTEGTITTWLKEVGDKIEVDEPLLEVSTDKVDTEIPSPVAGVLLEIKAEVDDTVDVGAVIAVIGEEGEEPAGDSGDDKAEDEAAEEELEEEAKDEPKAEAKQESKPTASGDATDVEMPELGESVTEGTITTWLKEVGDTVEVDEPLLEVSTDKVDTEIPSPVAGTLVEILAEVDDTVDVGAVIARIGDADAAPSEAPAKEEPQAEEKAEPKAEKKEEPKAEAKQESKPTASGDATDVEMPELGESVTEGTITTWLKEVGDTVEVDEPLLEVSTDKVDTEIPSPVAGTLVEILAEVDDTVDVGAVIARIGDADAAPSEAPAKEEPQAEEKAEPKAEKKEEPKEEPKAAPKAEAKEEPKADKSEPVNTGDNLPYVTPLVRKLAEKHGVDLSKVTGTGIGGRIRKQDVMAAAKGESGTGPMAEPQAEKAADKPALPGVRPELAELRGTTQKVNRIRKVTAAKTREALQTSAQLTQVHEVDMTTVWELRGKVKQNFQDKHGVKLTFLPFFVKAIIEALVLHPNVNASIDEDKGEITYHEDVNLAIAVDTERGLLTPVIHKAQDKSIAELAQEIDELATRARDNKLKPNDLFGATFTVTNLGSNGALFDTPILTPPQSGILGTGIIEKRPVVTGRGDDAAIAIRDMAYLALTYDHRLVDGADAGRFLTTIRARLEQVAFDDELGL